MRQSESILDSLMESKVGCSVILQVGQREVMSDDRVKPAALEVT